jgi:hypothetical protein
VVEPGVISDTNKNLLYFQECRAGVYRFAGLTESIIAWPANNPFEKNGKN